MAQRRQELLSLQGQQQVLQASAHGKGPRLYVGGIPDDVHEDDIKNHFERWGDVVDIYFPGKSGLKRVNYCFVTFDTWQAAQLSCTQSERSIARKASHIFLHGRIYDITLFQLFKNLIETDSCLEAIFRRPCKNDVKVSHMRQN